MAVGDQHSPVGEHGVGRNPDASPQPRPAEPAGPPVPPVRPNRQPHPSGPEPSYPYYGPSLSPPGGISPAFVPKNERERTSLVRLFIIGMLVLGGLLVCCIPLLVLTGHDAGVVVAPLTAVIAGLIGLFAASPGETK